MMELTIKDVGVIKFLRIIKESGIDARLSLIKLQM